MSETYQQAEIQSHTGIMAHLVNAQAGIKSHTNIIAHLDGAQCLQHTKKQAFSFAQTSYHT